VYTPHLLAAATLDGQPVGLEPQVELGANVYSLELAVPPGGTRDLVLHVSGALAPGDYRFAVDHQPTLRPDRVSVAVAAADGWRVATADHRDDRDGALAPPEIDEATVRMTAEPEADQRIAVGFRQR
jgi:hypothetical protein